MAGKMETEGEEGESFSVQHRVGRKAPKRGGFILEERQRERFGPSGQNQR